MGVFIKDAAHDIGVSPATLKRWFRDAKVRDVARDRNGYRIFEPADIDRIRRYAEQRFEPPPLPAKRRSRIGASQS
ncbi:MAG: MerR family transcriptional regulator [Candidatus Brocadiia bacterium]